MIVSTMIIILLVIVAIGIVWFVSRGVLQGGADEISLGKFLIDLEIKRAYVDEVNPNIVHVTVERGSGEGALKGVNFVFANDQESKTKQEMFSLNKLESKTVDVDISTLGISDVTQVSIVPVYESESGAEKLGGVLDTITLGEAAGAASGYCGDGACVPGEGEDPVSCVADCSGEGTCGDGYCDVVGGETIYNCAEDCEVPDTCDGTWDGILGIDDPNVSCTGDHTTVCLNNSDCEVVGGVCGEGVNVECEINGTGCLATCKADRDGAYVPDDPYEEDAIIEPPLLDGVVSSVWPGIAPTYMDSLDIPTNGSQVNFIGNYINFTDDSGPNLRTGCFTILFAAYVEDIGGYNMSHFRLEEVGPMDGNDLFQVWASGCCGDPNRVSPNC